MTVPAVLRALSAVALLTVLGGCGSADATGDRAAGVASPSAAYVWEQDCGVMAHKHRPRSGHSADGHSYEADPYMRLSLDEATERAKLAGLTVRVLGVDGDCADRTDDRRSNRVNFYVEDDVVQGAARF